MSETPAPSALPAEPAWRPETVAVTAGRPHGTGAPLNHPIVAASTFRHEPDPGTAESVFEPASTVAREYSRNDGSAPWTAFEDAIGQLEGGEAVSFASGMAAVSAVLDRLGPTPHVVIPSDCYQGVAAIVDEAEATRGWRVQRLATGDDERWIEAIDARPDLVWVESPSNPLLAIADVPALCRRARSAGVELAVDNTFASPLLQQPLAHGATFSVHSATKIIGGHSDLLAGVVVTTADGVADLRRRRSLGGATPGALEIFLALRGLRTLPIRLERSQHSAADLAQRLVNHRAVTRVRYPGFGGDDEAELVTRTLAGTGFMLSFETVGGADELDRSLSDLRLVSTATSLGGVETTIERRNRLAGQESVPPTLLRLSVGLEAVEDLWSDLAAMLDRLDTDSR